MYTYDNTYISNKFILIDALYNGSIIPKHYLQLIDDGVCLCSIMLIFTIRGGFINTGNNWWVINHSCGNTRIIQVTLVVSK